MQNQTKKPENNTSKMIEYIIEQNRYKKLLIELFNSNLIKFFS